MDSGAPLPTRPVVGGNSGLNCHISELLSQIIEPVASASNGSEVDSTIEMLKRLEDLNLKLEDPSFSVVPEKSDPEVPVDNQTADTELTQKSEKSPTEKKARKRTDIRFYGKEGKKSAAIDMKRR